MKKFATIEDLAKAAGSLAGHFGKASSHHDGMSKAHDALHKAHTDHAAFHKGVHDSLADDHPMKATYAKEFDHHTTKAAHHKALGDMHKAHSEHLAQLAKDFSDNDAHNLPAGSGSNVGSVSPSVGSASPSGVGGSVKTVVTYEPAGKAEDGTELFKKVEKPVESTAASGSAEASGIDSMIKETTSGLVKKSLEMLNTDTTVQDEIRKMVLEGVRSALGNKMVPTDVRGVLPDIPIGSQASGRTDDLRLVPRTGSPTTEIQVEPELSRLINQ